MKPLRNLFFCISLTVFFSCKNDREPVEFTFMTYNIYHGENYYKRGESNIAGIASVIRDARPDFIALQEVDSMTMRTAGFNSGEKKDLVKELETLTGMHGTFGKAIDYSEGGYGEGLLTAKPAKTGVIPLPVPAGGEGRALVYATYIYGKGKKITFAATHLCHEYEENRVAQVQAVNDFLLKLDHPVVLAGDLNFKEDSAPYEILQPNWTDSAKAFGSPTLTIPADTPRSRIDYIWLSKNSDWNILSVDVRKTDYSDHMPVVVKVSLRQ
ncbi:endonuclease [Sinomicrobium pectinilyticum]|uniref:Endonuclease n=2 Tax=Sinomicrobium pectinilyticum TaxID=1084421 RepID=A0A3N0E475_SINP1|nr:endonuclease [Sinomicrobium pectinilyticum]